MAVFYFHIIAFTCVLENVSREFPLEREMPNS